MPWLEVTVMERRQEFVMLAGQEGANVSALCRGFGISRKTGYRWLARARRGEGLADRSRQPRSSPGRTPAGPEAMVVSLRRAHPSWGGRKIAARLRSLGVEAVPAPSTVTGIVRRHGLLDGPGTGEARAWKRFEHDRPNALWQMDFKGHVALGQGRCHPLTVLDDHSRFALGLAACADERGETVQTRLTAIFRRYGLPERIITDNGRPWGGPETVSLTTLGIWLLRLGIRLSHSRPYHPQTMGKDERFHRTLNVEVLSGPPPADLEGCQRGFDRWRRVYNCERPHEALGLDVPASRYRPSPRPMPETLPKVEYAPDLKVRRVQNGGWISFLGHAFRLPSALHRYQVGLRPTTTDGLWYVLFMTRHIAEIDMRERCLKPVTHVPAHLSPLSPV